MISEKRGRRMGDDSLEKAVGETQFGYCASGRCVPKDKRTAFVFATRVLIVGLVVVVISGCGRYKQDLEEAKQRIDSLTADNKKCSEIVANLEKEKRGLTEERQAVDTKIDTLLKEIGDLKKTNAALSDELNKLKKNNNELSADLNSLRREKADLAQQIEELKRRADAAARQDQSPATGRGEGTPLTVVGQKMSKAPENTSPCEAVLAFMKAIEQVVRSYKSEQRNDMLEKVKQEYGPRMKGAPEKAIKNAEAWSDEMINSWDKPGDNTVFNLLSKRNAVLDACAKKPGDAGF
jgi:archaellum component FlaC